MCLLNNTVLSFWNFTSTVCTQVMESLSVFSFLIKLRIHLYAEDVVRASRERLLLQSYNPLVLFSDFFHMVLWPTFSSIHRF